jgi:hypothetical protein
MSRAKRVKTEASNLFPKFFKATLVYLTVLFLAYSIGALWLLCVDSDISFFGNFLRIASYSHADMRYLHLGISIYLLSLVPLNAIATAILASYFFAIWCSKVPPILMPKSLVIRQRTNGTYVLSITVGNVSYFKKTKSIRNVSCTINFLYAKGDGGTNGECFLTAKVAEINNFYRFDFNMQEIPPKVFLNFINERSIVPEEIKKNVIKVFFEGRTWRLFTVPTKRYYLKDIVVDDEPIHPDYRNVFEQLKKKYESQRKGFNEHLYKREIWQAIEKHPTKANEDRRNKILQEINNNYDSAET